jgi:hypothetical protein
MSLEIDVIEELRLRRWARENYVPAQQRNRTWHPVVHDEMHKKDNEHPRPRLVAAHGSSKV